MGRTVTASEANQNFSRILGEAEAGETFTIERRGKPIAKLVPLDVNLLRERRIAAGQRMIAFMRTLPTVTTGPWTRDELYDDDPDL